MRRTVSAGYRRILVPIVANAESERALDVACRLAAERHASIAAVTVIEVPAVLPLEAHMVEEEQDARELLRRGQAIGDSYGVTVSPSILRAREAAVAIVEHAQATRAEIIVLGGPRNPRRSALFGRTVQDVLKKAQCRVMVVAARAPAAASQRFSANSSQRPTVPPHEGDDDARAGSGSGARAVGMSRGRLEPPGGDGRALDASPDGVRHQ